MTILEIVDSQIRNHDPPEALATYDRLIGQGHSDEEARRLIGCVVASEVSWSLKTGQMAWLWI